MLTLTQELNLSIYKEENMAEKIVIQESESSHAPKGDVIHKHKKQSQWVGIWKRFKRNKFAVVGMVIFLILIIMSITAPLYIDYETEVIKQNIVGRLQSPSAAHWFGTDEYGRDVFARIVYGSRVSLTVGLVSTLLSLITGVTLGSLAGYYGGVVESIIMRFIDILLALPSILLSITIVAAFGSSTVNLIIAISIASVAAFARISIAAVITVKDMEYIEAAKAIGAKDFTIITRHILPNCFAPIVVQATLRVATSIMTISGLSFIGLGIAPPGPEWGNMLAGGRAYIREQSYLVLIPGMAIMTTILSLNLLGDGLRDALDPRLK